MTQQRVDDAPPCRNRVADRASNRARYLNPPVADAMPGNLTTPRNSQLP